MIRNVFKSVNRYVSVKTAEEFTNATKNKDAYVIQFHAEWCGPCKKIGPVLEKKQKQIPGWQLIKVDIDEPGNADLVERHQLKGVPMMVFVKDGNDMKTLIGNQPQETINEALLLLNN